MKTLMTGLKNQFTNHKIICISGIQNKQIFTRGKLAVLQNFISQKQILLFDQLWNGLFEIEFWGQYLCSAIIASRHQSPLVVGAPRKTCDFSCVPSQSSKRLCYCQRIFWRVLWKKKQKLISMARKTKQEQINRNKKAKIWNIICKLLPTTFFRLCT